MQDGKKALEIKGKAHIVGTDIVIEIQDLNLLITISEHGIDLERLDSGARHTFIDVRQLERACRVVCNREYWSVSGDTQ